MNEFGGDEDMLREGFLSIHIGAPFPGGKTRGVVSSGRSSAHVALREGNLATITPMRGGNLATSTLERLNRKSICSSDCMENEEEVADEFDDHAENSLGCRDVLFDCSLTTFTPSSRTVCGVKLSLGTTMLSGTMPSDCIDADEGADDDTEVFDDDDDMLRGVESSSRSPVLATSTPGPSRSVFGVCRHMIAGLVVVAW